MRRETLTSNYKRVRRVLALRAYSFFKFNKSERTDKDLQTHKNEYLRHENMLNVLYSKRDEINDSHCCDSTAQQLVLSTFSGGGLLDKAFKEKGFVVVSAGDIILNNDIRDFTGIKGKFNGLVGGPPCRWYSKANRDRSNGHLGDEMLLEFKRIVLECEPDWAVLENVAEVPNLHIEGYSYQRIDINQSWYEPINRLRHIQFYSKDNLYLHWERKNVTDRSQTFKCDSAALASDSRSYKELLRLQGLPHDLDYPDFTVKGKKKLIGNGVPLSMGRVIAQAVKDVTDPGNKSNVTIQDFKRCLCDCKRKVTHQGKYYDSSCRKRAQRKREGLIRAV